MTAEDPVGGGATQPGTPAAGLGPMAPGAEPRRDHASLPPPGLDRAGRRYPIGAVVLLALAAALMWASSRMTWVTVESTDGLTQPRTDHLEGAVWFGALTPLALVLLAAIAAVLATRGWLRRMFGMLIGVVAAVTAVPGFALLLGKGATATRAASLAELPGRATVTEVTTSALPALLSVLAAVAAFAAGVLLARMPEQTARLSGKYDNPIFRRAAATSAVTEQRSAAASGAANQDQLSERVLWDALDAGTDPTDDTPDPSGAPKNSTRGERDDRAG